MKLFLRLFPLLSLLITTGCDDDHFATPEEAIVTEGWIEAGEHPVVMLTKTFVISEEKKPISDLADHMLRWAMVKVSDGQNTEILTGKYDKQYFPPYIYTASDMRGVAGKQYWLEIEYDRFRLTATTTIPEAPLIDSVEAVKADEGSSHYTLQAYFADTTGGKAYYQLFTRTGHSGRQFFASYRGCLSSRHLLPYNKKTVYPPHLATENKYMPYYHAGDTVFVKLARTDSVSYSFWEAYEKKLAFGSNMMLNYDRNIPCNIEGGLGYWHGYNSSVRRIVIPKE